MRKSILDSRLYRWLEVFSAFLFLNLVWLVACLPVVTIFPATAALFAVAREWVREGEVGGAVGGFFSYFKQNFRQSLGVGIFWSLLGVFLAVNFFLIGEMPAILQVPLYVCFISAGVLYATTFVFLFPVLVNYDAGWREILKNSALLSLSQFPTTLGCLAILAVSVAAVVILPPTVLIAGSVAAYAVYRLCERSFQKVASAKRDDDAPPGP